MTAVTAKLKFGLTLQQIFNCLWQAIFLNSLRTKIYSILDENIKLKLTSVLFTEL